MLLTMLTSPAVVRRSLYTSLAKAEMTLEVEIEAIYGVGEGGHSV